MKRANKGRNAAKSKQQSEPNLVRGKTIEHGDIFFFYRPKIDAHEVSGVQRVVYQLT
jgi:predicted RNA-binding protein with PUA-like domain